MPGWKDAIEQFFKVAKNMDEKDMTELFKADLYRMGALYLGMQIDSIYAQFPSFIAKGEKEQALKMRNKVEELYDSMDDILASHKLDRLDVWLDWAKKWGNNESESNYYENDAKRIVTTWMPGVEDYAARTWHGLLREYYKPRMLKHIDSLIKDEMKDWTIIDDEKWHFKSVEKYSKEMSNPVAQTIKLVDEATKLRSSIQEIDKNNTFASFAFARNTHQTSTVLPISQEGLMDSEKITFRVINTGKTDKKMKVKEVHLIGDGKVGMQKTFDKDNTLSKDSPFTFSVEKMASNITANNESIIWVLLETETDEEAKLIMEVQTELRGK